jgi:hypothetical protein
MSNEKNTVHYLILSCPIIVERSLRLRAGERSQTDSVYLTWALDDLYSEIYWIGEHEIVCPVIGAETLNLTASGTALCTARLSASPSTTIARFDGLELSWSLLL